MNTDEIILVVEDEKEIADLLEVYLTNEGFKVLKAECSKDALDHIGKEKIALAILDACVIIGLNQRKPYKSRVAGLSPIILDRKIGTLTLPDDYLCSAA